MAQALTLIPFGITAVKCEYVADIASPIHLGGKGAGLLWMTTQGLPVPAGVVIPTTLCAAYQQNKTETMNVIAQQITPYLAMIREQVGYLPLFSVRSGARVSMPGMMDTILNVGLDGKTMPEWVERIGSKAAYNSYSRLVEMFGSVAKNIDRKKLHGDIVQQLGVYKQETGEEFPEFAGQLMQSIAAVFESWNNERAKVYRAMHNISEEWGTACVVQMMVFGNLNENSGTGVLFTRNPDSGANVIMGEFLTNAQGEDVVAGSATPMNLDKMAAWNPAVDAELRATVKKLEAAKKYPQDVEFTIQDGKLFILQTRNAKRVAKAAVVWALQLSSEGLLTAAEAVKTVTGRDYDLAQQPVIDPSFKDEPQFTGISACSGVVTGKVVKTVKDAVAATEPVILVSNETTPDDLVGMIKAIGVLTMTGGATSHAAVVARSLNKPCVVGLGADVGSFTKGETISMDGATGRVWKGAVPVIAADSDTAIVEFKALLRSGVERLVSRNAADLPDVLALGDRINEAPAALAAEIMKAAAGKDKLIVTFAVTCNEATEFNAMMGVEANDVALLALSMVPAELHGKLLVIGVKINHPCAFKVIDNLTELMMVTGSFVVEPVLAMSAPAKRLLALLALEGTVPAVSDDGNATPAGKLTAALAK